MKTFLYTTEFRKSTYGSNVTNTVYQIKNNTPLLIGSTTYNTGSFRGHDHEAMQVIIDKGFLPKNCMDRAKHGYINYDKQGKIFKLINL